MSNAGASVRGRFGLVVLALAAASIAALPEPGTAASASTTPTTIPLAAGLTTSDLSSVTLPMGILDQPENRFWEVFLQTTPATAWKLRTPPGVASNGGLEVAAPAQGPISVAFLPSQLLRFTPIAQSEDGGGTWSSGFVPDALVPAPDALVSVPSGTASEDYAVVVDGSGQEVLTRQGDGGWHALVTTTALARTVPGCKAIRITAVASESGSNGSANPVLGARCRRAGRIVVLLPTPSGPDDQASSTWSSVGPHLTGSTGVSTVLRLESSVNGLSGLAAVRTGGRIGASALVAFWRNSPTAAWSQSPTLSVPSGWTVRATATGGASGQGQAVLLGSGDNLRVVEIAAPESKWVTLAAPPFGTEALTFRGDVTDAFSVSGGSKLLVWSTSVGAATWQRSQVTKVPVPYGSSS